MQLEVEGETVGGAEFDAFADGLRETSGFGNDAVAAGEEVGNFVVTFGVGTAGDLGIRRKVDGGDFALGDGGTGGVRNAAENPAPGFLSQREG